MRSNAVEPAAHVLIQANDRYKLERFVQQERARRALLVRHGIRETAPGVWGVHVVQLRRFRRPWVRPAAIAGGVVGMLALSAVAGWTLVGVLAAANLAVAVGVAVACALVGILATGRRPRGRGCETTVIVHHRH